MDGSVRSEEEAWQTATRLYDAGDFDAAVDMALPLAAERPDEPLVWRLLGAAELKRGKPERAIGHLLKAAPLDSGNSTIWLLLGEAFEDCREWGAAADAFLVAVGLQGDSPVAHAKLFRCVADAEMGTDETALVIERWCRQFADGGGLEDGIARLDALFGGDGEWTRRLVFAHLSRLLLRTGMAEESVAVFSRSTLPATDAGPRENKDHDAIRGEYRNIAGSYEESSLARICARGVAELAAEIAAGRAGLRVLDAACGTGLVGFHLRRMAARLVGVDISPNMLAEAEKRSLYDELVEGDISRALQERLDRFDLVTCSDALYHLTDLSGFFAGAAACLVPGGFLAISADPCTDEWEVRATMLGGYAHSRRHLRRLAAENGLEEVDIRIREHRAHPGFYCAFGKAAP